MSTICICGHAKSQHPEGRCDYSGYSCQCTGYKRKRESTMSNLDHMKTWFADSDTWVGIFENQDLGHRDIGVRCAFPFAISDGSMDRAKIGRTHAPDGKTIGLGWRYILIAKCANAEDAYAALNYRRA